MILWLWMSFLKTLISLCWPMFYPLQVNETDHIIQDFCINQKDSTWWFWAKTGRWKERGIEWETWVCIRRLKDYVHFQRYNLHAFCVDPYRDPWPRICAVLDWDSILCHVSNRYDWKHFAFDYHHIRTQSPSAHVHFPRHARSHRYCSQHKHCAQDAWNLLVSCNRDIFWFLLASNVAHPHISVHRIRHPPSHGPGPLCSHLLSTQTCCHLLSPVSHSNSSYGNTQGCHSCSTMPSTDKVSITILPYNSHLSFLLWTYGCCETGCRKYQGQQNLWFVCSLHCCWAWHCINHVVLHTDIHHSFSSASEGG